MRSNVSQEHRARNRRNDTTNKIRGAKSKLTAVNSHTSSVTNRGRYSFESSLLVVEVRSAR